MFNKSVLNNPMFNLKFDKATIAAAALSMSMLAGCASGSPSGAPSSADYASAPAAEQASAPAAPSSAAAASSSAETSADFSSTGNINGAAYADTFFKDYGVNPFVDAEDDNLSTFAMDVDTASYTVARRFIHDGNMPDPASVRTEEFINYFKHDYTPPTDGAFAIHLEGAPSRFGHEGHKLLRVGLQGKVITAEERDDLALTFLIDISGSMNDGDRIGLAKRALTLLVDELRPTDSVTIITYGTSADKVLHSTMMTNVNRNKVVNAIDGIYAGGSTNAEAGLRLAYRTAWRDFNPQANNRVILVSDGVANVGATGPDSIWEQIKQFAEEGITLTSIGIGMGNYNDVLLEQLADNGNGNYAYVDTMDEARRIFVDGITGTLQAIAMDAKVQVDFNAEVVRNYRLIGYENRAVADEDFRNDDEDAGEVGAGHSVTALYEIKLERDVDPNTDAILATAFVRYQDPKSDEVVELNSDIAVSQLQSEFATTSVSFQLDTAVAEYAEILKESYWAQESTLADVLDLAITVEQNYRGNDNQDTDMMTAVSEFVDLVDQAEQISSAQARR